MWIVIRSASISSIRWADFGFLYSYACCCGHFWRRLHCVWPIFTRKWAIHGDWHTRIAISKIIHKTLNYLALAIFIFLLVLLVVFITIFGCRKLLLLLLFLDYLPYFVLFSHFVFVCKPRSSQLHNLMSSHYLICLERKKSNKIALLKICQIGYLFALPFSLRSSELFGILFHLIPLTLLLLHRQSFVRITHPSKGRCIQQVWLGCLSPEKKVRIHRKLFATLRSCHNR